MSRNKRRAPYTIAIDNLSHEGRGVGRHEGKTVFVSGALPGETVLARTTSRRGRFDEAIAEEVCVASPKRITPRCEHFAVCGGCALQHLSSDDQVRHKSEVLFELLQHHAGVAPRVRFEPLRGPDWGYRHKARLGVKYVAKKGGVLVGFREKASPYIADIGACHVLHASVGTQLTTLRELVGRLSLADKVPQIEVAVGDAATVLVVRHLAPLSADDKQVIADFQREHGIGIYLQPGAEDTAHPLNESTPRLYYAVDGERIEFLPTDFTQVNPAINRAMIALVRERLGVDLHDELLDLFCGLGNFSLPLARRAARVTGFEADARLIQRARDNARSNGLDNVEFHAADLTDPAAVARIETGRITKLLLDPPRSGAAVVVQHLALENIERIAYVSCNPVTLARDTHALIERGYVLAGAGIMDMFPHTAHVESMALFERA